MSLRNPSTNPGRLENLQHHMSVPSLWPLEPSSQQSTAPSPPSAACASCSRSHVLSPFPSNPHRPALSKPQTDQPEESSQSGPPETRTSPCRENPTAPPAGKLDAVASAGFAPIPSSARTPEAEEKLDGTAPGNLTGEPVGKLEGALSGKLLGEAAGKLEGCRQRSWRVKPSGS